MRSPGAGSAQAFSSRLVEGGGLALCELSVCAHGCGDAGGLERWEEEFRFVAVLVGLRLPDRDVAHDVAVLAVRLDEQAVDGTAVADLLLDHADVVDGEAL